MTLEAFGFETAEVVCASMVNAFAKMLGMDVLVTSSVVPMTVPVLATASMVSGRNFIRFFFDSCHSSHCKWNPFSGGSNNADGNFEGFRFS